MSLEQLARKLVEYSPLVEIPEHGLKGGFFPRVIHAFKETDTNEGLLHHVEEEIRLEGLLLEEYEQDKLFIRLHETEEEIKKLCHASKSFHGKGKVSFWFALSLVRYFSSRLYSDHSDFFEELFGKGIGSRVMDTDYRAGGGDFNILTRTRLGRKHPEVLKDKTLYHLRRSKSSWDHHKDDNYWFAYRFARAADTSWMIFQLTKDSDYLIEAKELIDEAFETNNPRTTYDNKVMNFIKRKIMRDYCMV